MISASDISQLEYLEISELLVDDMARARGLSLDTARDMNEEQKSQAGSAIRSSRIHKETVSHDKSNPQRDAAGR